LRFPARDFATFVRYHRDLKRLSPRLPLPPPLALGELDEFLLDHATEFEIEWT